MHRPHLHHSAVRIALTSLNAQSNTELQRTGEAWLGPIEGAKCIVV